MRGIQPVTICCPVCAEPVTIQLLLASVEQDPRNSRLLQVTFKPVFVEHVCPSSPQDAAAWDALIRRSRTTAWDAP